jgi:hypothetical protein
MTPFMLAVEACLAGQASPGPATEDAEPQRVAVATNTQVMIRSLAEQLVSEANTILRSHGRAINLVDHCRPGELAFTLEYTDRCARIETTVAGRTALSRIAIAGAPSSSRRLSCDAEVAALILTLIGAPDGQATASPNLFAHSSD